MTSSVPNLLGSCRALPQWLVEQRKADQELILEALIAKMVTAGKTADEVTAHLDGKVQRRRKRNKAEAAKWEKQYGQG